MIGVGISIPNVAALSQGVPGSPPAGMRWAQDDDGAYLLDFDGNYLYEDL